MDMTPREAADVLERLNWLTDTWHDVARRVLVDHARATSVPEIVTGEQAAQLPNGSLVCPWRNGAPDRIGGVAAHEIGTLGEALSTVLASRAEVRVLYRAPEPRPRVIEVGQTITTAAELDACPIGTTFRDADDVLAERHGPDTWLLYLWEGARYRKPTLPARVLDLGGA